MNRGAGRAVASRRGRHHLRSAGGTARRGHVVDPRPQGREGAASRPSSSPTTPVSPRPPFVALATAAAATSKIRLGTYVVNVGVRDPLQIATDVATLDVVSGGRAQLGIGAGHTPAEWTMTGTPYPSPRADHAPHRIRARHPRPARGRPRHVSRRADRDRVGRARRAPATATPRAAARRWQQPPVAAVRWRARRLRQHRGARQDPRRRPPARGALERGSDRRDGRGHPQRCRGAGEPAEDRRAGPVRRDHEQPRRRRARARAARARAASGRRARRARSC